MPADTAVIRRRRILALLAGIAVVAVVVGVLVARSASGDAAIRDDAARLVPPGALVYVHLSTDRDRSAVKDALGLADGFPSWARVRDAVLKRLVVGDGDVRPWMGDEMALALLSSSSGTAGSLVLLSVRDKARAEAFVRSGAKQSGPSQTYRGVRIDRFGALTAAFAGDFLVLGQPASVRQAIDLQQGRGKGLDADATYAKLTARLPGDRVADAYATGDGLRRLLVPAGGALGWAGLLLDKPNLKATALSLSAGDPGARVQVESLVPGRRAQEFEPSLVDAVPKGAMAYYGAKGLDQTATRLLAQFGTSSLADVLSSARSRLGAAGVKAVQGDLLDLLRDESAVVLLPGVPAPTLLVLARAHDEARTRAALDRLLASLKGVTTSKDGDTTVITAGSTTLYAAIFGGKLALSTAKAGIDAARHPDGGIGEAGAYRTVVAGRQDPVTSVVFLDFSQLLKLGEQTGLNDSRAYLAVKGDLTRVRSVGASSTGSGEDTTSEILFQIP